MALKLRFTVPERTKALLQKLTPETFETVKKESVRIWLLRLIRTLVELSPGTKTGTAGRYGASGHGATGGFRRSWRIREVGGAGVVENVSGHAAYVEEDTVGHWIFPRRAGGILAWRPGKGAVSAARYSGGGGERWMFARSVAHPGTKGQHVFVRAWESDSPHLIETFGQEADRALLGAGGAST